MQHSDMNQSAGSGVLWAKSAGSVSVRELDWLQPQQLQGFAPCDFVLATDCIYSEDLMQPLLATVLHLCTHKTQGMLFLECREQFLAHAQAQCSLSWASH